MHRFTAMATFVRVVETKSFSAAARQLRLCQPAVSKGIAQLEERLGVPLLTRSTHNLTPTEAGHRFYAHACLALKQAEAAEFAACGAHATLAGSLRVSASVTFGNLHIVPRLSSFLASHPNISIDLVLDDRAIDFIKEGIDVGLSCDPPPGASLTARKVSVCNRVVVGVPAYFEQAGVPLTPTELIGHAAVINTQDPGGTDTWSFRRAASEVSVKMSGRLRVSASEGLRAAVLGGLGLAVAPEWMFAKELVDGTVRPVLPEWRLPASEIWAVFPTGRSASVKARTFATFMESGLREQP